MRLANFRLGEIVLIVGPVLVGCMLAHVGTVATLAAGPARTAPPPKFDMTSLEAIFSTDARKSVGPGKPGPAVVTSVPGAPASPGSPAGGGGPVSGGWSAVISSNSIESEIKTQLKELDETSKTLNGFKSGGNVKARDSLILMAALFAVISKYDGEVKWKKDADGMHQKCAQAGNNCKTSSDNTYKEVRTVVDSMKYLMNGQAGDLPKLAPDATWGSLTVHPLMKRLEISEKEHLNAWVSDAGSLSKNKDAVIQEGELLAFIGKFIGEATFDNADAKDYQDWTNMLGKGGQELAAGAKSGDHATAAAGVSKIKQSCVDCHAAYR